MQIFSSLRPMGFGPQERWWIEVATGINWPVLKRALAAEYGCTLAESIGAGASIQCPEWSKLGWNAGWSNG